MKKNVFNSQFLDIFNSQFAIALDIAAVFKKIQFIKKNIIYSILLFDEEMSFLRSHHLIL
jgi:hypothetical protein